MSNISSRTAGTIAGIGLASFSRQASPYSNVPGIEALANMKIPGYATSQVIPRNMQKHLAILGSNNRVAGWFDVELKGKVIYIRQQLIYKNLGDGCRFHIQDLKTEAGRRDIPLTAAARKRWRMYRKIQ